MKFSFWPRSSQPWEDILALARHVENTDWDGFWFADHFMPNSDEVDVPWLECWTALTALAMATSRIRIGPMVLGNTYRHPAVLAKMAVTLDQISDGRAVLGLGAGWQENEHRRYDIPFFDMPTRLKRLEEACQMIRLLFDKPVVDFSGAHYRLDNAVLEPKPKNLPIMIGGGGEKVTLRIVARHADEWNVWGDPATLRQKIAILNQHCEKQGRDPSSIHRTAVALLFLSKDESYLAKKRAAPPGNPTIIGTPSEVRDVVAEYEEAGVHELLIPDFTLGEMERKLDTLDMFIEEVAGR